MIRYFQNKGNIRIEDQILVQGYNNGNNITQIFVNMNHNLDSLSTYKTKIISLVKR